MDFRFSILDCLDGHRPVGSKIQNPPTGFTLLEIILALAILAVAIAILGETVRAGYRNASAAAAETQAQLLAASKMAEITSGIAPLMPVERSPLEADPLWLYTVELQPVEVEGLLSVRVTVIQDPPDGQRPVEFSLTRWMPDPDRLPLGSEELTPERTQ